MAGIFISYSSKNRAFVDQLAEALTSMGYSVLYDQKILVGEAWWDKILGDIEAASIFIYALSPDYVDSYPCDLEYRYAATIHRYMLPVMIRKVDFKQVPSHTALTQVLDYTDLESGTALRSLVRVLNDLNQKPSPVIPTPVPPRPPAPISLLNTVIDKITDFSVTLSRQEQDALLTDIRGFVYKRETRQNARYVLERYRKRTDLLATVADEIDDLLELSSGPTPSAVDDGPQSIASAPKTEARPLRAPLANQAAGILQQFRSSATPGSKAEPFPGEEARLPTTPARSPRNEPETGAAVPTAVNAGRARGGLLSGYLAIVVLLIAIGVLIFAPIVLRGALLRVQVVDFVIIVGLLSSLLGVFGIWRWKKWGVYLLAVSCVLITVIIMGDVMLFESYSTLGSILFAILPLLVGPVALWFVVRNKWQFFEGGPIRIFG